MKKRMGRGNAGRVKRGDVEEGKKGARSMGAEEKAST